MSNIKRRHFLQFAVSAIAIGMSQGYIQRILAMKISQKLTLLLGIDESLNNNLAQVEQALEASDRIEVVPLQQPEVDYILGRLTVERHQELYKQPQTIIPSVDSIGLFSPTLEPILYPNSFGNADETVTEAIKRLQPMLMSLFAIRSLKTILNTNASPLDIEASMRWEKQPNQIIKAQNLKEATENTILSQSYIIPLGTPVQLQIINNEFDNFYVYILVVDLNGKVTFLYPNDWSTSADITILNAQQTLLIPDDKKDSYQFIVQEPVGLTQVFLIASATPLTKTMKALNTEERKNLELVEMILEDLQPENNIKTTKIAALSVLFEAQ